MSDVRLLVVLCLLTVTAAASAAVPNPVRATMSTSSTEPLVDVPWRYTVVVKDRAGKPLGAKMRLQVLRGPTVIRCLKRTAVVPCSGAGAGTWISFTGRRTGVVRWPARPADVKLTFQAVVVVGTRSLRLRAPVVVRMP
jgi:hypothetical protein